MLLQRVVLLEVVLTLLLRSTCRAHYYLSFLNLANWLLNPISAPAAAVDVALVDLQVFLS